MPVAGEKYRAALVKPLEMADILAIGEATNLRSKIV
jgi:hypothetical protein|tara:strand:- start:4289 stop:4396 length:108 start_codon:yes stop_codon:yes gene_type:complete